MNTEEQKQNLDEIKSEEVQAIIDRMPTQWAKYVATITGILIMIVFIMGFVIKYPDTVDGQISVTAQTAPVRIVANTAGRIHLLKPNKTQLKQGDVIAYIESGADYRDILCLDSLLQTYRPGQKITDSLPFYLTLGDVGSAYNTFVIAHAQYERLSTSNIYETMRKTLEQQITTDRDVITNIELGETLKKEQLSSLQKEFEEDTELRSLRAITEDEYREKRRTILSYEDGLVNLHSNRLSKQSEINKNKLEIQRLQLEETENLEKATAELLASMNALTNALHSWKEAYLQYATIDGELEYLGFWRENSFVKSGQELFSVIPPHNEVIGEVIIPSVGAGKVKTGLTANVKINNFPYDEYGLIKGEVQSLSRITNKIETAEGTGEAYQVTIAFPKGLITNFGIELPMELETKGTVEIITRPKRLIERLFDNLKAKTEK